MLSTSRSRGQRAALLVSYTTLRKYVCMQRCHGLTIILFEELKIDRVDLPYSYLP